MNKKILQYGKAGRLIRRCPAKLAGAARHADRFIMVMNRRTSAHIVLPLLPHLKKSSRRNSTPIKLVHDSASLYGTGGLKITGMNHKQALEYY